MSVASSPREQPPKRPAAPAQVSRPADLALTGLINTITALESAIEDETAALKARGHVDLEAFNHRKQQGLMELNRAMRNLGNVANHKLVAARLASLKDKLAVNQATLKFHLDAVREISTIVANAIRDSESDGTYSQSIRGPATSYGYD